MMNETVDLQYPCINQQGLVRFCAQTDDLEIGQVYRLTLTCEGPCDECGEAWQFGAFVFSWEAENRRYKHCFLIELAEFELCVCPGPKQCECAPKVYLEYWSGGTGGAWLAIDDDSETISCPIGYCE